MVYGGQLGCMFGAWNYMIGNFNYGDQPGCMVGAWIFMVGSFAVLRSTRQVWRSSMVYVCCMELCGRQFWSMEVIPGVCLVHGILW